MKKALKTLVLLWNATMCRDHNSKVVYYHDVGKRYTDMGTPVETFIRHMDVLHKSLAAHTVCFDDGFRGIWDTREHFQDLGIRPIVFVAVRLVGRSGYLTWDEISELQDRYGFDFQCHTWSHQTLAGAFIRSSPIEERTDTWFRHELVDSKSELESRLCKRIDSLCFPAGRFSDEVIRRAKEAGYKRLFASFPGSLQESDGNSKDDTLLIPRCMVQDLPVVAFKAVLNGGMNPLGKRYRSMHYVQS